MSRIDNVSVSDIISQNIDDFLSYSEKYQAGLVDSYLRDYSRRLGIYLKSAMRSNFKERENYDEYVFNGYIIRAYGHCTKQLLARAIEASKQIESLEYDNIDLIDIPDCEVKRIDEKGVTQW